MKKRISIARGALFVAMAAFSLTFLYPIFYMLINALKTKKEYFLSQFAMPANILNIANFRALIFDFHILSNFWNSLVVAGGATVLLVLFSLFSSYAFAKLDFRGKKTVYLLILATMFLPGQVSMIPAYVMFSKLHLINNYWAVILSYLAGGLPAAILLMTNGFMGISKEMIESAKIDGAGYFSIVRNVIVPMGMPAIAICLIFNIVGYWNDLLTPMLYLSAQKKQTVMVALAGLVQSRGASQPTYQLAGLVISILPVLIIYLSLQRYMIKGLSEGSIK